MGRIFIAIGSLSAFLAVALGAFGAHALRARLAPDMLAIYETGVKYHLIHSLGLILIGIILHWMSPGVLIQWSGWLLLAGIIIFSGSLYILSISGTKAWGAVTPLGGLSFLAGWILLAIGILRG
jgi:uncharacterized membrane protein YgdD (TMEM256/DUF423 family)